MALSWIYNENTTFLLWSSIKEYKLHDFEYFELLSSTFPRYYWALKRKKKNITGFCAYIAKSF